MQTKTESRLATISSTMRAELGVAAPYGSIVLWHGSEKDIPTGWVACDGQHGTPNLRDRFVVGAGSRYPVGSDAARGVQNGASYNWKRANEYKMNHYDGHGREDYTSKLVINFGEAVPAHHALVYIMRLDSRCCVCHCSAHEPARPVNVILQAGQAPDAACESECKEKSACGAMGGSFAHKFC